MPPKKKLTKADIAKAEARKKAEANRAARAAAEGGDNNDEGDEGDDGAEDGDDDSAAAGSAPAAPKKKPTKQANDDDYRNATGVLWSQKFSKDIKIGGFSLQAYGKELIQDTLIELTIGRRYGLIGQNGSGKSAYLKCLAKREVPIPDHIDIFHLDMEAAPSDRTALEAVVDIVRDKMTALEKEAEELLEREGPDCPFLEPLYARIDDLDPETFETRAGTILYGLGFDNEMVKKKTKDMSGGWRMRVSLAQALFVKPTLLLLDEPTNHLDLEACVWLETYLSTYPYCLVIVSHSEDFLNHVCTNIVELTPQKTLMTYAGNYEQYIKTKREDEVNQMTKYKKEQDDIKHIKQFIASCGTFSNLVRQAKSKEKILEKMYAAGLTPKPEPPPSYSFSFAVCERIPPPALQFQDLAFSYSGTIHKGLLYDKLNLGVDMDSRVALVGPNGAGKSTLLKLMYGDLQPTEGQVRRHIHVSMGVYSQHSADQLDHSMTPLDFMMSKYGQEVKKEVDEWRSLLGRYGVSGRDQKAPIASLSDGIKSRIVFAIMSLKNPNLLLLDEPTNHLDMQCIDALADAIKAFQGGVVLVSHDFRLVEQVAKELWVCDNKTVVRYKGSIKEYKAGIYKKMMAIKA